jgi:O-antigen ligase
MVARVEKKSRDRRGRPFSKTPLKKRWPVAGAYGVVIFVALVVGDTTTAWLGAVVGVILLLVSHVTLNSVFDIPWERMLRYREYD